MNIIGKRKLWYAISLLAIIPGIISLFLWGLNLGIDFQGGAQSTVRGNVDNAKVRELAENNGFEDVSLVTAGGQDTIIRFRDPAPEAQRESNHQKFKTQLSEIGLAEQSFDSVGPSVSADIARNALLSLLAVSIAIVLYIAYAFRNVPRPASSWNFGTIAIVALLHDALLLIGIFSLLGHFFGIEVDALFVTAVLTVIGFSVHDTIVVFDRIRETLRREKGDFAAIVNRSILETLARSINTSMTVLLTLLALLLFGGESIRMFVLALFIGMAAGTYSSILTAAPLLVTVHEWQEKRRQKALTATPGAKSAAR